MEAASLSQSACRRRAFGEARAVLSAGLALATGLALRLWMLNKF
jgi:hypothetical protein